MGEPELVLVPRRGVAELIDQYANGTLSYRELEKRIAELGYSTFSLFDMVKNIKPEPRP